MSAVSKVQKSYVQIQSSNFYQILRFIIENQANGLVIDERNSVQNFAVMTVRMDKPENLIPKSKRVEKKDDSGEAEKPVKSEGDLDANGESDKEVEAQPKAKTSKPKAVKTEEADKTEE